jgi:hypothetical protein
VYVFVLIMLWSWPSLQHLQIDSCKERDIINRFFFAGRESGEHAIQVIRDLHECGDAHAF